MSERPGGFAPSHRRVRRREEIIWLHVQGFTQVLSLLPSPHNLQAYEEQELACTHFPLSPHHDPSVVLVDLFRHLHRSLTAGERLLVHQEELGDRVVGAIAGYLLWSGRLPSSPQAVAAVEHLVGRQMGPAGREIVVVAERLAREPSTGVASAAVAPDAGAPETPETAAADGEGGSGDQPEAGPSAAAGAGTAAAGE